MRRLVLWLLAALLTIGLTTLFFMPAAWLGPLVEKQTQGRLTLGDAQGTFWNGSAFVGGAAGPREPVTPLFPGRFAWHISPSVLIGRVKATIENPAALSQPVLISGSWSEWTVSASGITLPAERLAGLGAPFNTILPTGQMRLSWNTLALARSGQNVEARGMVTVELTDVASRLSPVKPLGAYLATIDLRGADAQMALKTVRGPMLLNGSGALRNGRVRFTGTAQAEDGQEERLANFLNLLGQRRMDGDKNVIALEFK